MHHASSLYAHYDLRLVLLSYALAALASYTAAALASGVPAVRGVARHMWLLASGATLGVGIWAMHFTAMLAFHVPYTVTYDVPLVVASVLIVIVAAVFALPLAVERTRRRADLATGGIILGLGIAAMHYTGMAAMRLAAAIQYSAGWVACSIVVAIGGSVAALWLTAHLRSEQPRVRRQRARKVGSALLMGAAICGTHYTAMAGVVLTPRPLLPSSVGTAVNDPIIAAVVGGLVLIVCGLILVSVLISRRFAAKSAALASLFAHSPDAVFAFNQAGVIQSINPAAETLTGYRDVELLGQPLAPLLIVDDRARLRYYLAQAARGVAWHGELALLHRTRQVVELHVTIVPIIEAERALGVYVIASDITARKHAEDAIRTLNTQLEQRVAERTTELEAAANSLHRALTESRLVNQIAIAASGAEDLDQILRAALDHLSEIIPFTGGSIATLEGDALVIRAAHGPFAAAAVGQRTTRGDGSTWQVLASGRPCLIPDVAQTAARPSHAFRSYLAVPLSWRGQLFGVLEIDATAPHRFTAADVPLMQKVALTLSGPIEITRQLQRLQAEVAERTRAEALISHIAYHDTLTNLPNRLLFQTRLHETLLRLQAQPQPVALLFLDLDRFKVVNDTLGHDVGDLLLQTVAQRLLHSVRDGDTVARMGGDEFTLILPDVGGVNHVAEIARRILDAFAMPFVLGAQPLQVTTSIGISVFPADGTNATTLLKNADIAMYAAKAQGKNRFAFYSSLAAEPADQVELNIVQAA